MVYIRVFVCDAEGKVPVAAHEEVEVARVPHVGEELFTSSKQAAYEVKKVRLLTEIPGISYDRTIVAEVLATTHVPERWG